MSAMDENYVYIFLYPLADLKGARGTKFFKFHAIFGKIWQKRMLAPPPGGNPGSTTDINIECLFLGHMKHCTIVVADRFAKYLRVKSS